MRLRVLARAAALAALGPPLALPAGLTAQEAGAPAHAAAEVPRPGAVGITIERMDLSGAPLIDVRFTVRAVTGDYVQGLGPADVRVLLDSAVLDYGPGLDLSSRFVDGDYLTVVFAVDVSGSMRKTMPAVKEAIAGFVARLGEKDQVALLTFNERTDVPVPPGGDPGSLTAFLDSLEIRGNTAMFDAVWGGLDVLAADPNTRRALVAATDGVDNRSSRTADEVRDRAVAEGIPIYGLALGEGADSAALAAFADATGGRLVAARDPEQIRSVYADVAGLLIHEYRLAITVPPEGAERWHRLDLNLAPGVAGVPGEFASTGRPFLSTRGPGATQAVLRGAQAAATRAVTARAWVVIYVATLIPLLLLCALVARARRISFDWRLIALAVLLAGGIGGLVALLYTYY